MPGAFTHQYMENEPSDRHSQGVADLAPPIQPWIPVTGAGGKLPFIVGVPRAPFRRCRGEFSSAA